MNFIRNNKPAVIIVILIIVGGLFSLVIFPTNSSNSKKVTAKDVEVKEPLFVKEGVLHLLAANGEDTIVSLDIEIADNEFETTRGLMYRKSMSEKQGMLFIFPYEDYRSFWMKNTHISLDIIYADEKGVLGSAQKFTTPFSEASLPSELPTKYVLEVNAGFWDKYNLEKGCRLSFSTL